MTVRNLDYLFRPKSVALVGASSRPSSVGSVVAHNLLAGEFDGPVMPVNPRHKSVHGVITYPDVASLPIVPDMAVVCTPADMVPGVIAELGARGTKGAVVISAGFGEEGSEHGRALLQAALDAARPHLLRIVGPNCLGVLVPHSGLNASFATAAPTDGKLAFVAQSGAVVASVIDWAESHALGFSHLVSLGDMVDVDFGDMLDYLANDPRTRAILLYVEAVKNARRFMSAARAAARMKPVIVVKAGRFAEAAQAAASHTGALAGADDVYDAVFKRAGMLRVFTLHELFDAVEILSYQTKTVGERLAIVSNGGGIGVMATDALMEAGGRLAELSEETIDELNKVLPPTWSHGNPLDIIGDAPAKRYGDTLDVVLQDRNVDAVLVLNCPTAVASSMDAAEAVVDVIGPKPRKPVLTSWIGGTLARPARTVLAEHNLPTYETPEQAIRAFMYLVNHRRSQDLLMETPPSVPEVFEPDWQAARGLIDRVLAEDRDWMTAPEAKDLLKAYEIPVGETRVATSPDEAADVASTLGFPVALKVLSPDIVHKSDVGGVALNIVNADAVRGAAYRLLESARQAEPDAALRGLAVETMIDRPGAFELIVGMHEDAQFGPVILFGQGGTAVEVIGDRALGLPPLNMHLARELISETRIYKQLRGYRDRAAADLDAIALTLIKVSQLVTDFPEIAELDINPLLADAAGVVAVDSRVRIQKTEKAAVERLAIRPYPKELEETIELGDGRVLLIRPIVPEDEPSLQATFGMLTPEEVRLRFFVQKKTLSHMAAARFTQLDFDREMALVLTEPGVAGETEIYGVVHITADPDNEKAEYAIVIRGEMTGMGLGIVLMRRIIDYAKSRGIKFIHGDVLRENSTMLRLCEVLGFTSKIDQDDPSVVRVTLAVE